MRLPSLLSRWVLLLSLSLLAHQAAHSDTLYGSVVGLSDGDTITVLDTSKAQHRIRLAGIDAPEKKQPFGDRSRQSLASLVFGKNVQVEYSKTDRYGRIVGKVLVNDVDASLEQVKRGLAWHYKVYEREQNPADRVLYAQAELDARRAHQGLWADPSPIPPWDFRKSR